MTRDLEFDEPANRLTITVNAGPGRHFSDEERQAAHKLANHALEQLRLDPRLTSTSWSVTFAENSWLRRSISMEHGEELHQP